MPGALNVLKTVTADITTTPTSVYSTPLGYATVVLMAQVSNNGLSTIGVTASHVRASPAATTALVTDAQVPTQDAYSLLTGRLVLQYGDSFEISATDDTSGQLVLSFLETQVG